MLVDKPPTDRRSFLEAAGSLIMNHSYSDLSLPINLTSSPYDLGTTDSLSTQLIHHGVVDFFFFKENLGQ